MRVLSVFIFGTLVACGGDPFASTDSHVDAGDDEVVTEGGDADASPEADGQIVLEGAAGDVDGPIDAISTADSPTSADGGPGPDADAGPACCMMPTAACSYPLASCPIAAENHGTWPTSFELYTTPAENCATTATPAACLCDYTCACIAAHFTCPASNPNQTCSSDPVQGIVVTCSS